MRKTGELMYRMGMPELPVEVERHNLGPQEQGRGFCEQAVAITE